MVNFGFSCILSDWVIHPSPEKSPVGAKEFHFNVRKLEIVRDDAASNASSGSSSIFYKGLSNVDIYFIFYILYSIFCQSLNHTIMFDSSVMLSPFYFVLLLSDYVLKCNCPLLLSPHYLHLNIYKYDCFVCTSNAFPVFRVHLHASTVK